MSPRRREHEPDEESWRVLELKEPRYSQSVEKGLAVLACFTPVRPVLGVGQMARELGMSASTTHRYVATLAALGYLERNASYRYRLALRVTKLGISAQSSTSLREQSRSYLEELRQRTSYTVSVAVLDGAEILYVDRVRSSRRGQHTGDPSVRVGSRLPAYCTSMGKVLLANLPAVVQRDLVGNMTFTRRGPNSIMSKKALRAELEHVFDEGMAVSDEELRAGLVSIAAPIRDEFREVVAAASLEAHTSMISLGEMVDRLSPHLLATADNISARLGYRRDDEVVK
jgi:IclR family pca regulon transcriptional regulator